MSFRLLRGEEKELTNALVFTPTRFQPDNVEFCFQFGDEEPVVFATGPNSCNISIRPETGGNIIFNNNGNVFKLFARERE